jgi:hypothetical protein
MTGQIKSLIIFCQKTSQFRFILKTVLFSVWVPISEERKINLRKPYLRVLARIAESLYSGGRPPALRSASAYVGSGVTSYSASESESTISPECKRQPDGTTHATSMGLGHPPPSFRPSPPLFSLQIPYSIVHMFLSILFMADSTHE